MKKRVLDNKIESLDLSDSIINKLHNLNINLIYDLWQSKRAFLKENGLSDVEICQIKIKLQLHGIDLNSKVY